MNRTRQIFWIMLAALPLVANAEWQKPAQAPSPAIHSEAIRASVSDPVGDTFAPGPDITGIIAVNDDTGLSVMVSFATPIEPPPGTGTGMEVIGFIDLDTDQNAATGTPGGSVGIFCPQPPANFGVDFSVDLGSFNPINNTVNLLDSGGVPVDTAHIQYGTNSLSVVVAASFIGHPVNLNIVTGNQQAPSDCAPDGAILTSILLLPPRPVPGISVPSLNPWGMTLLILLTGIVGLALQRRRIQ